MASGEPILVGSGFAGLDRATAAHLLAPNKSPQTTDAGANNEIHGILGPRFGRKKVAAFDSLIRGIVPCNFPIGRFRIVAYNGGFNAIPVPWPTPTTNKAGWVQINVPALAVTGTIGAGGYYYSPIVSGFSLDLANYSVATIMAIYPLGSRSAWFLANSLNDAAIQFRVNGSFLNLVTTSVNNTVHDTTTIFGTGSQNLPSTGIFDGIRLISNDPSAGNCSAFKIYLINGTPGLTVTAS